MYLGFDLGTSCLKAVLISTQGQVLSQAKVNISTNNPKPLWSEQDPKTWWNACVSVVNQLKTEGHQLQRVKSIGVTGHMHGATLLDADGAVLRPCILWNDGRSFAECETLTKTVHHFSQRSGNLAMPGFTAPKLLWVANNEPTIFSKIDKVLLPKDYLNYRLTGLFCSEMSDAAGTLWLNPATRSWDKTLLNATGLTLNHMPSLHEGNQQIGMLSKLAAQQLGLLQIPVVAGAGDNAAGAIGVGVTEPGQAFLSLGTSGVYFVVSERHHINPERTVHAFCHCLPQRWHQMSVSLSAANSVLWFANLVQMKVSELLEELENSAIKKTPISFLPYLSGERTPHNDPLATGMFFGITNATTRPEMTLAILEGVAYSLLDGQEALEAAGVAIKEVTLIGGGARCSLWRQILADVLKRVLVFRDGGEIGPGLGAARLAHLSDLQKSENILDDDLRFTDILKKVCPPPVVIATHKPDFSQQFYYQKQRQKYQALYQQTQMLNDEK